MIRTSAIIAAVAVLVSLLLHVLGLSMTTARLTHSPSVVGDDEEAVTLGTAFEDLAEQVPEPIEPEEAEVPEPPVETSPEPEEAEIPTSEALVASPDPQEQIFAPDTGPSNGGQAEVPEPEVTESVDQSETQTAASDDVDATPLAEPSDLVEIPQASAAEPVEPVETTEAEQLAALPPVEVAPVPLEQEAIEPEIAVEPLPEEAEPVEDSEGTEQAVATSLRPRLPNRTPSDEVQPTLPGARNFDNLKFPEQTIESPLSAYQREGIDAFTRNDQGNQSGGRGPGNSTTTNYAGQVLVHLNRAPRVYAPVRGYAQVFFQIDPDGSLAWVEVITSSGSDQLDRAAKDQVRGAAPFPPPPGGVSRKLSFYYQNG